MSKIKPCLWFDDRIEEAVNFYVSLFPDSKITETSRYPEGGPGEPGKVMVMNFNLSGTDFMALNGGPEFKFTEAVSFVISCETQDEVDDYWTKLSEGGEEGPCGWLKDKYGLSWQIVPSGMEETLNGPDKEGSKRAFAAMVQMGKIDVAELERAYRGA